jgi:hypothetical protein
MPQYGCKCAWCKHYIEHECGLKYISIGVDGHCEFMEWREITVGGDPDARQ